MATLYFNAAVDNDWDTLGNWWTNAGHTTQATTLPTSADDVIATDSILSNSGSAPTVVNFTLNDPSTTYRSLAIAITVTGNATFNGVSINYGTVSGDATFNDSSRNNYGTVTGDATFNDSSYNDDYGIVSSDATFNDSSRNNYGTVTGDATFNDSSRNYYGYVTGDATFNDSSYNYGSGTVTGDATFNDSAYNDGYITGNATFNDGSYNGGTVTGNAFFRDSSYSLSGGSANNETYEQRTPYPIPRGINGSSILGVV